MNIEDLISQYIDGDLSSEAEAEMHHRLAVSPEARKLFRAQIALREAARNAKVLHAPAPELRAKLFQRLEREEGMKPVRPSAPMPSVTAEIPRSLPSRSVGKDAGRRRRAIAWLLPSMVASIVAVALVWNAGDPLGRPVVPELADRGYPATAPATTSDTAPPESPAASDASVPGSADAIASDAAGVATGSIRSTGGPASPSSSCFREAGHGAVVSERMASDDVKDEVIASEEVPPSPMMAMGEGSSVPPTESLGRERARRASPALAKSTPRKFQEPELRTLGAEGTHDAEGRGGGMANDMAAETDGSRLALSAYHTQNGNGASPRTAPSGMSDTVGRVANRIASQPLILASASAAHGRSDDAWGTPADIAWESDSHGTASLYQISFVEPGAGSVNLDVGLRGGVRLAGGHVLFAMVGMSGYHESTSEMNVRVASSSTTDPSTTRKRRYEAFAGAGYQYIVRVSKSWDVGAGAWSSVGSRYVRAGIEIPVTYTASRQLRLHLLPTVRYSGVHGGATTSTASWLDSAGDQQTLTRTISPDGDATVDVGIGVGASLIW